ncbi:hypothetical protein FS749_015191, partial [Ceratobasidium sp. UAMH 11750]
MDENQKGATNESQRDPPVEPTPKEEPKVSEPSDSKSPSQVVHTAMCDACDKRIVGIRHKCTVCDDFDLCDSCYDARAEPLQHKSDHEMRHIERPTKAMPVSDDMAAMLASLAFRHAMSSVFCGKRSRSDSNSSGDLSVMFRQVFGDSSSPNTSDDGPPSPQKEESTEDVDEVIKKVKREKLDEHERALLPSIVDTQQLATTFASVYLPEDTVDMVRSMVSLPLLCPEEFQSGLLKQYTISGALLFGPPGTGKTLFAQALAKESGARMIAIKPSDILHKYVGEPERLVRAVFKLARRLKPCVIFIDELDALFGTRTSAGEKSSSRWHTSMITEFMQEMDGLLASQVIVLGATNRPFDLDDAVLRRLPCRVMVDMPEKEARREILKILLREETLAEDVELDMLAERTLRYSGSDLK